MLDRHTRRARSRRLDREPFRCSKASSISPSRRCDGDDRRTCISGGDGCVSFLSSHGRESLADDDDNGYGYKPAFAVVEPVPVEPVAAGERFLLRESHWLPIPPEREAHRNRPGVLPPSLPSIVSEDTTHHRAQPLHRSA